MTVQIEVIDDDALNQLKALEEKKIIRLLPSKNGQSFIHSPEEQKPYDPKEMAAFSGALQLSPEQLQEYLDFVNQLRNEWE